jgi:hypothetical protein
VEQLNGSPALVVWDGERLVVTIEFEVENGLVSGLRMAGNPDKLRYLQRRLGPPGSTPVGWWPVE